MRKKVGKVTDSDQRTVQLTCRSTSEEKLHAKMCPINYFWEVSVKIKCLKDVYIKKREKGEREARDGIQDQIMY